MTQDGSNLFNARTLSKMSAEIEPTPEQVSSAEEWLGLLEAGALHKERKNYFPVRNPRPPRESLDIR